MKKGNPFQAVAFNTVEECLAYLPHEQLQLVEQLRALVLECIPHCKEKLAYNVPFYYGHSRICFIWPGAVGWGGITSGVQMGFCKGHLLSNNSYFNGGGRKEVFIKTFQHRADINPEMLRQLLYEAVVIDEEVWQKKKRLKSLVPRAKKLK